MSFFLGTNMIDTIVNVTESTFFTSQVLFRQCRQNITANYSD